MQETDTSMKITAGFQRLEMISDCLRCGSLPLERTATRGRPRPDRGGEGMSVISNKSVHMHTDQQEMEIDANFGGKSLLLSFPRAECKKRADTS